MKFGRLSIFILSFALLSTLGTLNSRAQTNSPSTDPTFSLPISDDDSKLTQIDNSMNPTSASWIWSHQSKNNQTVLFRKNITVAGTPKNAKIQITADDSYILYVNGLEIDRTGSSAALNEIVENSVVSNLGEQMKTSKSKSSWQIAHTVDITATLIPHENNTIAVVAKNDLGSAGLLSEINWTDDKGSHQVASGHGWKVYSTASEGIPELLEWKLPNFNDLKWKFATVIAPLSGEPWRSKGGLLNWPGYHFDDKFYLKHLLISPVSVKILNGVSSNFLNLDSLMHPREDAPFTVVFNPGTNLAAKSVTLLLDFGQEYAGSLVLTSSFGPAHVRVSPGESSQEAEQDPWTEVDGLPMDLEKDSPEHSTATGFRYMVVQFTPTSPSDLFAKFSQIKADFTYYPVTYEGSFESSDPLLNKIWYAGAYTTHLCMQDDVWDAPKRDRKRWMGDMMVSGDVINNVFGDRFLMEQTLTRIRADAQRGEDETALPKKHVDNAAPFSDNGLPGYSYAWISQLASFQRHTGDMTYLLRQHDLLVSMLEYILLDLDKNGVFQNIKSGWNFVDWSPEFDNDSPNARMETNLFLVKALEDATFLLKEMHDSKNALKYEEWATKEREIVRKHYLNARTLTFGNRRQTNAMAVYAGVTDSKEAESIYNASLKVGTADWKNPMTPYFLNYVIYAQSMSGHTQEAMDYIKAFYGSMLDLGSSTWFERWDLSWPRKDFHSNMPVKADGVEGSHFVSLAHAWSAGPTNWLTERVLGIRPTGSGFTRVDIDPDLANLKWARGRVPTPRGLLFVHVEKAGTSHENIRIELPPQTVARVFVNHEMVRVGEHEIAAEKNEHGKYFVVFETSGSHYIQD